MVSTARRLAAVGLLAAGLLAPLGAAAQAAAAAVEALPDEPVTERANTELERSRIDSELKAGPPPDLWGPAIDLWWARLFQRAAALGADVAYPVAEARFKARSQNPQAVHRWSVAQLSRGRVDEFQRLSESAWRMARAPVVRASLAALSASWSLGMLGDVESAGRWLQRAEDDLARAGLRSGELLSAQASTLGAKARWLTARGQYAEARRSAVEAVERARAYLQSLAGQGESEQELGRRTVDRALSDLIATQIDTGQHFDAQQTLQDAQRLMARDGSVWGSRWDLVEASVRLRMEQGRYADAAALAETGVARLRPVVGVTPSARYLRMLLRLQDTLAAGGQWSAAWDALQVADRAVASSPSQREGAANPLVRGWVLLQLGRATPALAVLEAERQRTQALLGPRHLGSALASGLSAWALWEAGRRDEALARFDEALPVLLAPPGAAEDFMSRGLRQMIRRAIFEAYLRAASAPTASGGNARALDALRLVDHLMGSSVQDALNDAALRSSVDATLQDLLRREQDLRQRVNALLAAFNRPPEDGGDVAELRRVTARLLREVNAEYLLARDALQAVLPREARADASSAATPGAIAAQLAPGEVFVMLWPAADATYVWAVPARGGVPRFHAAPLGEREVAALVARVRRSLEWPAEGPLVKLPTFDVPAAARLHEALLAPLGGVLSDAKHWIVASGGALGQIPLAVLPERVVEGAEPVPWLLRRHAFSHWPSARAWVALAPLRQARRAEQALLAWADPVFTSQPAMPDAAAAAASVRALELRRADLRVVYGDIPPLPDTRDEVQAIAATLRADPQRDLVLGERATRGSVLEASRTGELARRRVIVFATHGLLAGDLPNLTQPALAMSSTPEVERDPLAPLLTLDDVLGLKLNADWVVLSACNTAGADGRAEEAMSGLARGFFYAGARSLLVTHWAVETESAKLLTTGTFAHFAQQPLAGRAESLRQAMLKVMAQPKYAHPIFWAPYALVGDGGL